ncbi:Glycoside hydrolase family 57 [Burkholderiales bacterium]|nr:Glycoside hydrolase family 57 [Burkholderiales bacterium]
MSESPAPQPAAAAVPLPAPGSAPGVAAEAAAGLDLLLLWHMHQPDYRDRSTGDFTMPWVYLHAIKDYADMAWHLEQQPGMRAVVNFVPVLLDQIEDYCDQFRTGELRDPLLRLLARAESTGLSEAERQFAFQQCFRVNHHRLIAPFPPYKRLYDLFVAMDAQGKDSLSYLSDRYLYDLVTWHHLAWTGETVRRESEIIAQLMAKGSAFSEQDRAALLRVIAEQVQQVIPRYRALAQRGQIELSTTPHCHPLAPLMLDFRSARDALPNIELPEAECYPGGRERVCAHIDSALASHTRRFGAVPAGLWPAEGALSASFAALLAERKIGWSASSEGVLANSLRASGPSGASADPGVQTRHRPYRASKIAPGMLFFFRDDRLSDLIGFSYSKWHGRDAASNFVHELEAIAAKAAGGPRPLVSVMLDGENAWEYYPYNGFFFLSDLYKGVASHPGIRTVTGSDMVTVHAAARAAVTAATAPALRPVAVGELPVLAAGSWVYGNFATWIGAKDKNRAWDLLCEAKASYDRVIASGRLDDTVRAHALAQLADCEASDWFWWPGEDNPSESVSAFETLFRGKLAHLYRLLQLPVPESLTRAFSKGGGNAEVGGTMRRGNVEPGMG